MGTIQGCLTGGFFGAGWGSMVPVVGTTAGAIGGYAAGAVRGLAGITGLSMRGFQLMIRIASGIRSLPRAAQYALIYCAVVGISAVAWTTQIPERRSGSLVLYSFVVMPLIVCLGVLGLTPGLIGR